jgi:hypothetical protein
MSPDRTRCTIAFRSGTSWGWQKTLHSDDKVKGLAADDWRHDNGDGGCVVVGPIAEDAGPLTMNERDDFHFVDSSDASPAILQSDNKVEPIERIGLGAGVREINSIDKQDGAFNCSWRD